jgi:hypothetical protein
MRRVRGVGGERGEGIDDATNTACGLRGESVVGALFLKGDDCGMGRGDGDITWLCMCVLQLAFCVFVFM